MVFWRSRSRAAASREPLPPGPRGRILFVGPFNGGVGGIERIETRLDTVALTMQGQVAGVDKRVDDVQRSTVNILPRLRAHDTNIARLRDAIERVCSCKVALVSPEKF